MKMKSRGHFALALCSRHSPLSERLEQARGRDPMAFAILLQLPSLSYKVAGENFVALV